MIPGNHLQMNKAIQYWAVIPAAGVGKRMMIDRPKQYLQLHGKTVIEHTLNRLLCLESITGVVLSITEGDEYWPELNYQSTKPLIIAKGGKERSDSVLNALLLLNEKVDAAESVYALVHDAARPCVRLDDIQLLISEATNVNGGLLATPVRDTMKRSDKNNEVHETVDRNQLWHALTPQMFRLDLLISALQNAQQNNLPITDDASAMELAGYKPKLIKAHEDNIKITRAFDLELAELFTCKQNQR
jgi:2-C-methyl-D-erythritol 4-phosphate cytidylyltransferase